MNHEYLSLDAFVAYCRISTWVGTSAIGAQHYYGKIIFEPNGVNEDLSFKLDRSAAVEHNKGLQRFGRPSSEYVKPGEITTNFRTEDLLRAAAISCFQKGSMRDRWDEKSLSLKGALFLIEGDHGICQPQEVLACAPGFEAEMEALNKLFREGDGWYWERDSHKRLDALSDRWYQIMKEVRDRK